jgi:hypothetical protein
MTPMQLQYLIGLCCLKNNPDAVEITVGDLVLDNTIEDTRDVDITVTFEDVKGIKTAFKAYEVKKECSPLDVSEVEQLAAKLNDMTEITNRAIVSASGFTKNAIKKAESHKVELYEIKPWTTPLSEHFESFNNVGHLGDFIRNKGSFLLYWVEYNLWIGVTSPKNFNWKNEDILYTSKGKVHSKFQSIGVYSQHLLLKSTQMLFNIDPAKTILQNSHEIIFNKMTEHLEVGSHSHTLELKEDKVFLKLDGNLSQISYVTITGILEWQRKLTLPEYYIIENVHTKEIFAGAAITPLGSPDDRLLATILTPKSNEIKFHWINLTVKQKNFIRKLKLK